MRRRPPRERRPRLGSPPSVECTRAKPVSVNASVVGGHGQTAPRCGLAAGGRQQTPRRAARCGGGAGQGWRRALFAQTPRPRHFPLSRDVISGCRTRAERTPPSRPTSPLPHGAQAQGAGRDARHGRRGVAGGGRPRARQPPPARQGGGGGAADAALLAARQAAAGGGAGRLRGDVAHGGRGGGGGGGGRGGRATQARQEEVRRC